MPEDTKKAKREAARRARLAAERRRRAAERKRKIALLTVLGVLVATALTFAVVTQSSSAKSLAAEVRTAGCSAIQEFPMQVRNHIPAGQAHAPYNSNPPTSGPHLDAPADWGTYPDTLPPERLVHNLEHGGIVIHFKDLGSNTRDLVEKLVDSYSSGVISEPDPVITAPIAMAAWQHMRTCQRYSSTVIKSFIRKFCNKGPEPFSLNC